MNSLILVDQDFLFDDIDSFWGIDMVFWVELMTQSLMLVCPLEKGRTFGLEPYHLLLFKCSHTKTLNLKNRICLDPGENLLNSFGSSFFSVSAIFFYFA